MILRDVKKDFAPAGVVHVIQTAIVNISFNVRFRLNVIGVPPLASMLACLKCWLVSFRVECNHLFSKKQVGNDDTSKIFLDKADLFVKLSNMKREA